MFATCSHGNIEMTCPSCRTAGVRVAVAPAVAPAVAAPAPSAYVAPGTPPETRAYLISNWDDIMQRAEQKVLANRSDPDGHGNRYLTPAQAQARAEAEGIPFA